ncbi:MAG TPA: DUF1611 domain-containing protein [Candidatus Baltobacteraceae bacterium]
MRRYLILAPGALVSNGKTAHGVIRYSSDETVAVVDPQFAGRTVGDVLPYLQSNAPIVASVAEGLRFHPTALLIGTAPRGGQLPDSWRVQILAGIRAGLEIVSGLHELIGDDPELANAAATSGARIFDVRKPPSVPLFSGNAYTIAAPILLTVGNDCAVGKMTAALELVRAAQARKQRAVFVPTGQTAIMIAGWGISVDRVISDFAAGAAEQLVLQAARQDPDLIVVEGQGAINHPAYAGVTLSLLFGSTPDAMLLVVNPRLRAFDGYDVPVLGYADLIRLYEGLCATIKPAKVLGIVLNTFGLSDAEAIAEIQRAGRETGLPADDVVRFGALNLYDAIAPGFRKGEPLCAPVRA